MMKQKYSYLLSPQELVEIFSSGTLFEAGSFFIIDPETNTYNEYRKTGPMEEESKLLFQKYSEGATLIVRNLEHFNEPIRSYCAKLGRFVDVHMYLVPPNGNAAFEYHKDDCDVIVHLVYGKKTFYIKDSEGNETEHVLHAGDELFIKQNTYHKAKPHSASCLLSFGHYPHEDYKVGTHFTPEHFQI